MTLRFRLGLLATAAALAAWFATELAMQPLCTVFRSARHQPAHTVGGAWRPTTAVAVVR